MYIYVYMRKLNKQVFTYLINRLRMILQEIMHLDYSLLIPLVTLSKENALFFCTTPRNESFCGSTIAINKVPSKFLLVTLY